MMVNAKEGRWAGAFYEMHNQRRGVGFYRKQRAMVWLTKGNGSNGSGGNAGHQTSHKWLLLENQLMKAMMQVRDGKGVDGCIFPIRQTNTGKGNMAWFIA